jgi:hypothetical protein
MIHQMFAVEGECAQHLTYVRVLHLLGLEPFVNILFVSVRRQIVQLFAMDVEFVSYLMCAPPAQEVLVEHNANYQYVLEVYPIPQRFATIERVHAQILILVFVQQVYGLDLSVQLRFVMESLEVLVQCAQLEAPVWHPTSVYHVVLDTVAAIAKIRFVMENCQMTQPCVVGGELVLHQMFVHRVSPDSVDPFAICQFVMGSFPMTQQCAVVMPLLFLHREYVNPQIIVHVANLLLALNVSSMSFIGRIKVEFGPTWQIGSSTLLVF